MDEATDRQEGNYPLWVVAGSNCDARTSHNSKFLYIQRVRKRSLAQCVPYRWCIDSRVFPRSDLWIPAWKPKML